MLVGRLDDGTLLDLVTDQALAARLDATSGRHRFRFDRGAEVEGRLQRTVRHADGRLVLLELGPARLTVPGAPPREVARYLLLATGDVVTAHAGASDAKYHADTPFSPLRVPRPAACPPEEREVLELFERAERAFRSGTEEMVAAFPQIHAALERDFPEEWLLRWNMLESLLRAGVLEPLARTLWTELERLELAFDGREPIASGLRYLGASGCLSGAALRNASSSIAASYARTTRG